jgi:two-component system sensor histidine kinase KdpD
MPVVARVGDVPGTQAPKGSITVRRTVVASTAALTTMVLATAVMLALRPHLAVATAAVVLVVPVIVGVAVGGFPTGVGAAIVGFFVYDWFFIPPYGALSVSSAQDWVALAVYLIVVLIVARLVAVQQDARRDATFRTEAIRRLFEVSEHLIGEQSLDELLSLVVTIVHETFGTRWVALLLPVDGSLTIAATAGEAIGDVERAAALGPAGATQSMALVGAGTDGDVRRVALTAVQRPVGQLVVAGTTLSAFERQLLGTFANEAALAIERSQLRGQALRADLLEEVDRWRSALVGAVSHDLRTPLASIKAAVSTLREPGLALSGADHNELLATIEDQSDHLTMLVANLLDMARLEAGTLALRREPHDLTGVVDTAIAAARAVLAHHSLAVEIPSDLPIVEIDAVLIVQVLSNLLTNAAQHSPDGTTITVAASERAGLVDVSVSDEGPGVPEADRERIFHMLDRNAGSGRAGLGLAISTAFVEAHGQRLRVADGPSGGACFKFQIPVATLEEATS